MLFGEGGNVEAPLPGGCRGILSEHTVLRGKLPRMVFFTFFFLARVNAVSENICDSPGF